MTETQIRFGLMPVLDAVRELPRTVLLLKSVRYHFAARGGLAEVEMTQVYCQEKVQPLDCEYLFPLPADGAVYRCEATINGRVIRARVEEREAARRMVAEKKAEGRRTALVESERDNLFTLSLGNIQPQDVVEVKLAYLQPLRRLADKIIALDLPLCPGVRYIPGHTLLRSNRGSGTEDDTSQVPDASRISPPRIDAAHPDAAFIELDGEIEAGFLDGKVESPSHQLAETRRGEMAHITLAHGGEVPDRDLALRWNERQSEGTALRGWISRENDSNYALLELRAPASVESTEAVTQDFYFLVDRSGSMEGPKWQKAIQALQECVGVLGPNDRAAVTLFESSFKDFDAEPVSPAALRADPRFGQLASLGTKGGTEMEPALRHVLEMAERFSKDRPAVLVLITDAEIGNEREIISLMRQRPSLPVHCFGIDTTLNDSLLLDLVRQQGGTFHALHPADDVAAVVTRLGRTLRQPVLVNLQPPAGWEVATPAIPNLYAGQIHLVSLRATGAAGAKSLTLLARDHRNTSVRLEFDLAPIPDSGPRLRWCKERLVALVAQDEKSAAITLSKESNLLCPLTAFVAWDEQQKVEVASHRLVQPSLGVVRGMGPMLHCRMSPPRPRRLSFENLVDENAMECLLERADPAAEDSFRQEKLGVEKRIESLLGALARETRNQVFMNLVRRLLDFLQMAGNMEAVHPVVGLLNECERILEERTRRQRRLQELTCALAGELEQTAASLRHAWCGQEENRERLQHLQNALVSLESVRQEVSDKIREMAMLEAQLQQRLSDFLNCHEHPPTPASQRPQKKRRRALGS